jgi:hypothetical protein
MKNAWLANKIKAGKGELPMSDQDFITPTLARSIEDAILFGHIKELDAILDVVETDDDFPVELRYGLEALRYFREHYGKEGMIEPTERLQKQKVQVMESAWGAELLEMLHHGEAKTARRQA